MSVKPPWILSAIHKGNPWNPARSVQANPVKSSGDRLSNFRIFFVLWYVLWFWKSETELSPNQEKKGRKKLQASTNYAYCVTMLTLFFNTSWQTEGSKCDSGYLLCLIQIQGNVSTTGHTLRVPRSRPEGQSLSENGHSSDCQCSGLSSKMCDQPDSFLQTQPLSDAGSVWCACLSKISISIHILVEFKVVLKYIQQYPQHLVHLIFYYKAIY